MESTDISGATPLRVAVLSGQKNIVELLIANKADYKSIDRSGWSVLDYANTTEYTDIIEYLKSLNIRVKTDPWDYNAANRGKATKSKPLRVDVEEWQSMKADRSGGCVIC